MCVGILHVQTTWSKNVVLFSAAFDSNSLVSVEFMDGYYSCRSIKKIHHHNNDMMMCDFRLFRLKKKKKIILATMVIGDERLLIIIIY